MDDHAEKYWKHLPLAHQIYNELFGKPKTHNEWAEGFNIRGRITEVLIKKR